MVKKELTDFAKFLVIVSFLLGGMGIIVGLAILIQLIQDNSSVLLMSIAGGAIAVAIAAISYSLVKLVE